MACITAWLNRVQADINVTDGSLFAAMNNMIIYNHYNEKSNSYLQQGVKTNPKEKNAIPRRLVEAIIEANPDRQLRPKDVLAILKNKTRMRLIIKECGLALKGYNCVERGKNSRGDKFWIIWSVSHDDNGDKPKNRKINSKPDGAWLISFSGYITAALKADKK